MKGEALQSDCLEPTGSILFRMVILDETKSGPPEKVARSGFTEENVLRCATMEEKSSKSVTREDDVDAVLELALDRFGAEKL
jgi:hypothetical protein